MMQCCKCENVCHKDDIHCEVCGNQVKPKPKTLDLMLPPTLRKTNKNVGCAVCLTNGQMGKPFCRTCGEKMKVGVEWHKALQSISTREAVCPPAPKKPKLNRSFAAQLTPQERELARERYKAIQDRIRQIEYV